jgi:hypothetical protein
MERYFPGPFEGPPAIKPPALPEDIYLRNSKFTVETI